MMKKSKNVRLKQLLQLGTFVALIVLIAMVGAVMTNAEEVKYSEGLEFTSNGNGTCSVSGIGNCTDTEIVIPPESPDGDIVTHIEDWAISLTSEVTNIVIPNTVKSVDFDAFAHCYNLVSITFPASVTNINGSPLRFCYSLESIVVEEGNTVYHSSGNCLIETETKTLISGCQKSVIPTDGSVTKIGNMAFYNCLLTEAVEIPEGIVSIGDFAFQLCDGLVSVSIPDGVKEIGAYAFGYCANLTEVKMTDSVKRMGAWAFSDCHKLEKIILSKNIQIIEGGALSNTKITSIVFPPELTAIEGEAFSQCAALRFVRIPDTVQRIDDTAFDGCHNLKAIVIPKSVKMIMQYAFNLCDNLTDVFFTGTKEEWQAITILMKNEPLLNAKIHYSTDLFALSGASLTLGDSLTMNYYAKADPAYGTSAMRFTYRGKTEYVTGVPTETEGEYVFSLTGIAPQCMGETIKAELIVILEDGTELVVDAKESYSVREYCDDALAANPDNKALATLLADLLAYGDASQSYTGFNADTPVSEGFAVAPSEWEDVTDTDFTLSDKTRDDLRFASAGVRFAYVNRLYFKIKATDLTGVTLTVNGKTYTAKDLTLVEDTADTYILYTDPVYATEFDRVFTAELSVDGRTVQTLTYSVRSYVYAKQNSENTEMAALVRALYTYGRSAVAYKNEQ